MKNNADKFKTIADERTEKKVGTSAMLCLLFSLVFLAVVIIVKALKNENALLECIHFFALLLIFMIVAHDWGTADPPSYFLSRKKISIERFGSRIKVYAVETGKFALVFALFMVIIGRGFYEIGGVGAFWKFMLEFLLTAVTTFLVNLMVFTPIIELQVKRYKKKQKQIAELEAEEMRNAEELLMADMQTDEIAEILDTAQTEHTDMN